MPRWVLLLIVAPLVLCVTCTSLGYFVLLPKLSNKVQTALTTEMANALATSLSAKIASSGRDANRLVLTAADLDVNNAESFGDCGFDYSTSGTFIYGVDTDIDPAGITLTCGVTYSSVPVILNGRVDMTDTRVSSEAAEFVLSKGAFEKGLEEGINRALTSHGLQPTAITLLNGSMVIEFSRSGELAGHRRDRIGA